MSLLPIPASVLVPLALVSIVAYVATVKLIPPVAARTLKAGLAGRDLCKRQLGPTTREQEARQKQLVPESLGLVCGPVFILAAIAIQTLDIGGVVPLVYHGSAMTSITLMILLGFADDVLDLPWRVKLVLPLAAAMPLVLAYDGVTAVVVPRALVGLLGARLELGLFYKLYMLSLGLFCTNCINIYAGVNGLEVGQSIVIAVSVMVHNVLLLGEPDQRAQHVFSLCLMVPFVATSLGLLRFNWFPSRVFVGDTYTYFAGMVLAVAGILGHFSKTLLLLCVPQVLNFLISLPQLLKIVPCPRHRLPTYNAKTDKLEGVRTHLNLVNQTLVLLGPLHERTLVTILLGFQVACSVVVLAFRHTIAEYFF